MFTYNLANYNLFFEGRMNLQRRKIISILASSLMGDS
jgi:hypothetical protein